MIAMATEVLAYEIPVMMGYIGLVGIGFAFSNAVKHEVRRRQKGICSMCGQRAFLQVHHIIPQCQDGLDEIENAIGLCEECHNEADFEALKLHIYLEPIHGERSRDVSEPTEQVAIS